MRKPIHRDGAEDLAHHRAGLLNDLHDDLLREFFTEFSMLA